MYEIQKRMEIAGAHKLNLPYESKCSSIHGHNWIIWVHCRSEELDKNGMVVDFTEIKRRIHDKLDHKLLNDVEGVGYDTYEDTAYPVYDRSRIRALNPTAERIAEWICNQIESCYKVSVQESEGNIATYTAPGTHND